MASWLLAEFTEGSQMASAALALRADGHAEVEAFSPYAVPEAVDALRVPTPVPLAILLGGLAGIGAGALLQWYCNAYSFPINVGGRPMVSGPAYVPICFECMILLASLSGLYGFFISAKLPQLSHRLEPSAALARSTLDRFVLALPLPLAELAERLSERLYQLGAAQVSEVPER